MFIINTYLPRINKTAKLAEFTNKHCFNLSKFYFNGDDDGISCFFDSTIKELLINKEIFCELTCIEKLIILLDLYYNCLYENISLYSKDVDSTVSISVKTILNFLKEIDIIEEKKIIYKDIKITLNAPCGFYLKTIDNIFSDLIYSISADKEIFFYSSFTNEEKNSFLSSLPSILFDEIIEYYNSINKKEFNILPENNKVQIDPIILSITNGTIFTFLKSIFNIDLKSHYNNMLIFAKQFDSGIDSYFSLTTKDFLALYKIYENSIKQNESSLKTLNA